MKKISTLVISAGIIINPILSQAELGDSTALKYSNCPNIKIIEPENSNGYIMSADCKQVYIKPPKTNKMSIVGFGYTGGESQDCQIYTDNLNERNSINRKLNKRKNRLDDKIKELDNAMEIGGSIGGMSRQEMRDEVDYYDNKISDLVDRALKEISFVKSELSSIAQKQGAKAKFLIEDSTSKLRDKFIEVNPEKNLIFTSITPTRSTISYNSENVTVTDQGNLHGDILKLDIPMEEGKGAVNIGQGDLSGQIKFSRVGSCALSKNGIEEGDSFPMESLKHHVVVNRFNEYTVHVRGGYSVHYNLYEIVKVIQKQSKKRGFFKNKTKNERIDLRELDESIKVKSINEEKNVGLTVDEVNTVKKEFIDRALKQIIALKTGNTYAALNLLQPDAENGADVASKELSKCLNIYCQIGAAGLKVLSSIFGSSESMSVFKSKFDANLTEEAVYTLPISVYSSSTYQ